MVALGIFALVSDPAGVARTPHIPTLTSHAREAGGGIAEAPSRWLVDVNEPMCASTRRPLVYRPHGEVGASHNRMPLGDPRAARASHDGTSFDGAPLVATRIGEGQRLLGHEQLWVFAFTWASVDGRARRAAF
jgi:hypothetical protein